MERERERSRERTRDGERDREEERVKKNLNIFESLVYPTDNLLHLGDTIS